MVGTDLTLAIHKTVLPAIESTPGPVALSRQARGGRQARLQERRRLPHVDARAAGGAACEGAAASEKGARRTTPERIASREVIMTDFTSRPLSRRTLVKAGLGAIAAPAVLRVIPANAQSRAIKIGHVSPRTGPLAGFGEADTFILEQVRGILGKGLSRRRQDLSGADHQQGQPVERQPRLRSRLRADPRRQGRPHRRLGDARHHQSGRRPGRGQRGALHHHQLPVAALFLRPPRRSEEGLHLDLSFLLGPGGRDRGVPRAVGRRADQQGGGRPLPQRRRRQCLGRSQARPAAGARRRPATSCTTPAATS